MGHVRFFEKSFLFFLKSSKPVIFHFIASPLRTHLLFMIRKVITPFTFGS